MGFAIVNKLCYNVPAVAIIAAATQNAQLFTLNHCIYKTYLLAFVLV